MTLVSSGTPDKNETRDPDYRRIFDVTIADTLQSAVKMIRADPVLLATGTRILYRLKRSAARRMRYERVGILVPAIIIVSITSRCNLACKGCYMRLHPPKAHREMSHVHLASIVSQAAELGVAVMVIAGGEPLLRKQEIFDMARNFPDLLFLLFTNGLLIDDETATAIAGLKNIVPVISFEGFEHETDVRRGTGVYGGLLVACSRLRERKVFFGCSVTVDRENFDRVTDEIFVQRMIDIGARVFTYVEYVPIEPGTEGLVLSDDQRNALNASLVKFTEKYPALFIGFPGDEKAFGGCLAAGRGFVHISPAGDIEPCPAAPFSDANLITMPLKEALKSRVLRLIRNNHGALTETQGGCALWTNREWVQTLLHEIDDEN